MGNLKTIYNTLFWIVNLLASWKLAEMIVHSHWEAVFLPRIHFKNAFGFQLIFYKPPKTGLYTVSSTTKRLSNCTIVSETALNAWQVPTLFLLVFGNSLILRGLLNSQLHFAWINVQYIVSWGYPCGCPDTTIFLCKANEYNEYGCIFVILPRMFIRNFLWNYRICLLDGFRVLKALACFMVYLR